MTPSRLPRFSSPEEEARFWMETDSVDYWDQFRETGDALELAPPLVRAIDQRSTSKRRISLYLDVQNVYNAQHPEATAYGFDYRSKAEVVGLPILPIIGLRGEL